MKIEMSTTVGELKKLVRNAIVTVGDNDYAPIKVTIDSSNFFREVILTPDNQDTKEPVNDANGH